MHEKAKCPSCGTTNIFERPSFEERLEHDLPGAIAKAVAVTIAGALTGGIGLLIAGGAVYASNVKRFLDGTQITCRGCGSTFKV